jgi:hypothetical protein
MGVEVYWEALHRGSANETRAPYKSKTKAHDLR